MFSFEEKGSSNRTPININPGPGVFQNLTQPGSSDSIKILLFPPANKQFRFDEHTNQIEIEPAIQGCPAVAETTLTPFVENCNFFSSTPTIEKNQLEETDSDEIKVKEILQIKEVFQESRLKNECILKGCKWSGDGLCLLSNSEDNVLRLFEINGDAFNEMRNDIEPVLEMKEGGIVYDYVWYPKMNSSDPISCVFASTSQNAPIHLWDAYTGQLRATYQPINQYDEVTSAYSLTFSPDGLKLYSGFKKCVRIFDTCLPGRVFEERNLKTKGNPFQSNIISCISINPRTPSLYSLGSYNKTIGIYTEPEGELLCILNGHSGGVTQIQFSADGNYLYSGARKDDEILCWDVRNPGKVVFSIERKVDTQQKILFDLSPDQNYLITGTTDSYIKMYNVKTPSEKVLKPMKNFKGHNDCVNGVQFHPNIPVFASSSGQRHFRSESTDEEENESEEASIIVDNSIKLWSYSLS